jgi:hypothetical protein
MEFIVMAFFIIAVLVIYFIMEFWWILLIFIGMGLFVAILFFVIEQSMIKRVVKATVIGEEPIIEQVSEKTGHTTSYGRGLSYHEHYRYRNVVTGYNVTFAVEYKNGSRNEITCRKNSGKYNKLIIRCNHL